MFEKYRNDFKTAAAKTFNLELQDQQIDLFFQFGEFLLSWNEKINLTAITNPQEIITKHFLDSLVFVRYLIDENQAGNIIVGDIGTGAGFPGIPLKIVMPEIRIILIDSLLKRVNYLKHIITELNLHEITAIHARAEDMGRIQDYRGKLDFVVSRAVADLPILLEFTIPLLKVEGKLLAAKGKNPEDEIERSTKALDLLKSKVESVNKYSLGEAAEHRSLIIVNKQGSTPSYYPRKAGKPKKSPL